MGLYTVGACSAFPHSSLGYRPSALEAIEPNWLEIAAGLTHQVV